MRSGAEKARTSPADDGRPIGQPTGSRATPARRHDPEQTRRDILDVATQEFARLGLAGARVDAIAARTLTTKRMIYYYFESKEKLYEAVLEKVYGGIRDVERQMGLTEQEPVPAMRALVETTFDYHDRHPDFIRLVTMENLHAGQHLKRSPTFRGKNVAIIRMIDAILQRGSAAGVFREGLDAIDLHMLISSFCFHRIANRHTFGTVAGRDPLSPRHRMHQRAMLVETVMRYVCVDAAGRTDR
ncbi:TetR/AcrR family transcriptional regulator [Robbsia sp. Bb-Pol-6]|uniref:TetR/AcrR family transcriptional regulator n=1 Tax=Robbsia betulipollinis TaxID=2981849 RepID=A0ABT3ZIB3_9BURK|nr:TetR/AcrR family transcriptional regulator [Robbsia betulipollinis]MCY0386055.1 TetR/AcrR family transcriptional regulator [Robbsia betulipollinis]